MDKKHLCGSQAGIHDRVFVYMVAASLNTPITKHRPARGGGVLAYVRSEFVVPRIKVVILY